MEGPSSSSSSSHARTRIKQSANIFKQSANVFHQSVKCFPSNPMRTNQPICKMYSTNLCDHHLAHSNFIPFSIYHKKKINKHFPHTNQCCFPIVGKVVNLQYSNFTTLPTFQKQGKKNYIIWVGAVRQFCKCVPQIYGPICGQSADQPQFADQPHFPIQTSYLFPYATKKKSTSIFPIQISAVFLM
jgi:hypothetical protein